MVVVVMMMMMIMMVVVVVVVVMMMITFMGQGQPTMHVERVYVLGARSLTLSLGFLSSTVQ